MRLPVTLTVPIVVATLAGTLSAVAPVAHAANSTTIDYGATWTVDTTANSLSEFAPNASGAATAIATIQGAATGLSAPTGVAVTTSGTLFVANSGNNSITEYPNGAAGNTPPSATIKGSSTGLAAPSSITFVGGELWVTDPSTNVVEAFTAGSSGNELPAETIAGSKTLLNHPVGVAVDDEDQGDDSSEIEIDGGGTEVYVINAPTAAIGSITGYSTDKLGDVAPNVQVANSKKHPLHSPTAIVLVEGTLWVADGGTDTVSNLFVLPPEDGEPSGFPTSQPIATIAGSATGIDTPSGLGFNALDQLVVANAGDHSLRIFASTANGDVAPIRTLTGLGSTAGSPAAAAVLGTSPSAPTNFKVTIHRNAKSATATMSWDPPTVTGGGILGYEVLALDITRIESLISSIGGGSIGEASRVAASKIADRRFAARSVDARRVAESSAGASIDERGTKPATRHTTVTKKNLKLGHSYLFGVVAVNAFGISAPTHLVIKTLAIDSTPPLNVKASSSKHSISVHWAPPKNSGGDPVTGYRIEYGTCVPGSKGCTSHSKVVTGKTRFATIHGLKGGTTYDVRMAAKTKHGLGKLSNNVTAIALA
jgi:hypothetical protein